MMALIEAHARDVRDSNSVAAADLDASVPVYTLHSDESSYEGKRELLWLPTASSNLVCTVQCDLWMYAWWATPLPLPHCLS